MTYKRKTKIERTAASIDRELLWEKMGRLAQELIDKILQEEKDKSSNSESINVLQRHEK